MRNINIKESQLAASTEKAIAKFRRLAAAKKLNHAALAKCVQEIESLESCLSDDFLHVIENAYNVYDEWAAICKGDTEPARVLHVKHQPKSMQCGAITVVFED